MSEIESIRKELARARKEIQNLRKQVSSLTYVHHKEIQSIKSTIENYKCEGCTNIETMKPVSDNSADNNENLFKPIGFIRTAFSEKRAVPRQPTTNKLLGRIEISQSVFNNPEHSLDGLHSFSHIWIIYHFHRNESHPKAKVAPPRLGGSRVGVFSTRSPHRPCPIGLSLVEINKIDHRFVYFYGTDMVDGTPVLDIKPYIPAYDFPDTSNSSNLAKHSEKRAECTASTDREEPEGEENFRIPSSSPQVAACSTVKVPKWIDNPTKLNVVFTSRASEQLAQLELNENHIQEVVSQDPRSVYLRTKHGSQLFTFQISNVTVSCQFDDENATVTVVQILKAERFDGEVDKD
ncbi:tRNA (adenine(37)-N6)-methyltransferase [Pseudolycoriella hygida]|uniref:tRNA (Adenine(37)-N6)-methyltransferase n=1 Tax=Pseudolycoriella hygida TaxID=35572 RepID=A0A9Q0N4I1_9DIPT|nr:tRNA (adenine(37)-N6)-methyltransferase [Pseudolycoriella hygida]